MCMHLIWARCLVGGESAHGVSSMSHIELHVFYVINRLHNNYIITRIYTTVFTATLVQPTHEMKHEQ